MRTDILVFLFVLGILFFSWPIISIFSGLVISLFGIWLVFIILIFLTTFFSDREDGS